MWREKGRSGIGDQYTGDNENSSDHTYEGWTGVSPNGRQFKSPVTDCVQDLSGANYWHMRKQLPNKLATASEISYVQYKTPSYYHLPKKAEPVNVAKEELDSDVVPVFDVAKKENVMMSLTEDNVFRKIYIKLFGDK